MAERVGEQIVRLIAMFAMQLMAAERDRLKLFSFDEGWRLLGDPVGRMLLASLQRMGRSELAVPIISTQLVSDTLLDGRDSLENLIGATFVFGLRSENEAARALRLLDLDPDDELLRRSLHRVRRRPLPDARPPRPGRSGRGRCRRPVAAPRPVDHPARRGRCPLSVTGGLGREAADSRSPDVPASRRPRLWAPAPARPRAGAALSSGRRPPTGPRTARLRQRFTRLRRPGRLP